MFSQANELHQVLRSLAKFVLFCHGKIEAERLCEFKGS